MPRPTVALPMFGTSGIRGRVGEDVTADLALAVGHAGASECGADAVRLGLASTPTVARAVAWADADAGVSVTASHNPPADNGLKLWQPSGQAFDSPMQESITDVVEAGAFDLRPADDLGTEW